MTRLRSLEYLSLAFNQFDTSVPTFFGRMTSLNTLNLRSSGFIGEIPQEIGYLAYLGKFLSHGKQCIDKEQLSDEMNIPIFLRTELLLLDDNSFSGTIPSNLGSLSLARKFLCISIHPIFHDQRGFTISQPTTAYPFLLSVMQSK